MTGTAAAGRSPAVGTVRSARIAPVGPEAILDDIFQHLGLPNSYQGKLTSPSQ